MTIREGDYVTRKSYGQDILFRVIEVDKHKKIAYLKGLDWRLLADAPLDDLVQVRDKDIYKWLDKTSFDGNECLRLIQRERELLREKNEWLLTGQDENEHGSFEIPGRVLHLDGDSGYVKLCTHLYQKLKIPVHAYHVREKDMPEMVVRLLKEVQPDILILTGHDSYKKSGQRDQFSSYRNSRYFVEAVKEARKWEKNKDKLTIFAGACQSFFEAILEAGANFASSPKRINIHAQDPVYVAEKASYCSIRDTVNVLDMVKHTVSGIDGIGGIETLGSFRMGIPLTSEMERGLKIKR
ncbi:MAG: sporulation peptidase YabG [Bacillaceae bacterium]|nr:sporulation peptidase YabG [Bacillaceae bacterium]